MRVSFTVPRKPVGINELYVNSNRGAGGGKGRFLSSAGRDFKECAAAYALVAAKRASWPRPEAVKAVLVDCTTWNTKHDVDAPLKALCDAFEGILYKRDSAVQEVRGRRASDDGIPRVEVIVEIL